MESRVIVVKLLFNRTGFEVSSRTDLTVYLVEDLVRQKRGLATLNTLFSRFFFHSYHFPTTY